MRPAKGGHAIQTLVAPPTTWPSPRANRNFEARGKPSDEGDGISKWARRVVKVIPHHAWCLCKQILQGGPAQLSHVTHFPVRCQCAPAPLHSIAASSHPGRWRCSRCWPCQLPSPPPRTGSTPRLPTRCRRARVPLLRRPVTTHTHTHPYIVVHSRTHGRG